MKNEHIELLEKNGWTVECESPFEIRHDNGSFATMTAANQIFDDLRREDEEVQKTIKSLEELNAIELEPIYSTQHCQYSVLENKLATIYKNQEKILAALKLIGNNTIFYDNENE